jgi:hypothetical protein
MEVVGSGNALETCSLGQPNAREQFPRIKLFMGSMKADRFHFVSLWKRRAEFATWIRRMAPQECS